MRRALDNDEFVYGAAYAKPLRSGNTPVALRIADEYFRYIDDQVFTFFDDVSKRRRLSSSALPATSSTGVIVTNVF